MPIFRILILLILFMLSFANAFSQLNTPEKELDEAVANYQNLKYMEALPILKKYSNFKGFDSLRSLELSVYLNSCYLITKDPGLNVKSVNSSIDSYLSKHGFSKVNIAQRNSEMISVYLVGVINFYFKNYDKTIYYLSKIKKFNDEFQQINDKRYVDVLFMLTQTYFTLQDFKSAIKCGEETWKTNLEFLGEVNANSTKILDLLYMSYFKTNDLNKELECLHKRLKVGESLSKIKTPEYIYCLNSLAGLYNTLGKYEKALEISTKAVDLGKDILGENNQDYLNSLNSQALAYSKLGNYAKASEINFKIVRLGKDILGAEHKDYFTLLNNQAEIYSKLGDFQNALKTDLEVAEMRKKVLGEKHPDYLSSLSNLAVDYSEMGDFNKALILNLKTLSLRKEVLGEKDPAYLMSLSNLASSYSDIGNYSKAIELNLETAALRKEVLGEKHPDYLSTLSNLAVDYSILGDERTSIELNFKVLAKRKELLGEKHPDYLLSLSNLAQDFSHLGDYKKSRELDLKILQIRKEVFGEKHPDYLSSLSNLAVDYNNIKDFSKALEIDLKLVALRNQLFGEKHPDYLLSLSNLAQDYSKLGNFKKAKELDLKVLNLRKDYLGENHPDYILSISNLGYDEFYLHNYDQASSNEIQAINNEKSRLIDNFSWMNEHQRELFWVKNSFGFSTCPTFLEKASNRKSEGVKDAYDIALFTKGIILNTSIDFTKLIAEKGTPEAIAKFEEVKTLKLQIQQLTEKPLSARYLNVDSLENIAQQKETELIKLSKEYGDYTQNLKVTWKDIQTNLGFKDIAIEFVEYPTFTDTIKYAALVLRKGWQYPKMISLFRKDQIQELIRQDKNLIYSNNSVGKQIKELIWDPLEAIASPGDRIYFSPAGIIHQLAIESLPATNSLTLGDKYEMHRLSSTKELVIHKPKEKNLTAVLYGGLQYDLSDDKMVAESNKYGKKDNLYAMRGYDIDTTLRRGLRFLAATKPEVDKINSLMKEQKYQVVEYTGESGNEESFKSLSGKKKGIIHIATHGFFETEAVSRKDPFIQMRMGDRKEGMGVDPMLRSGLMLSGANRAWMGEKIPDKIEDGVLTSREISRMDLRGTDLVVLSACETGLGEVSSEGVFGLQRSFKQAGVQTLLMSLWQVSDQATSYMMTEFYTELLSGKDKRTAFLEAKRKCRLKYTDPKYWAAFIMLD